MTRARTIPVGLILVGLLLIAGGTIGALWDALMDWPEHHEGLAAWVQAVGIITTLSVGIYFSSQEVRRKRRRERQTARSLVSLLPALTELRGKIKEAQKNPRETKNIRLTKQVTRRARDIQLLEGARDHYNSLNSAISELQNAGSPDEDQSMKDEDSVRELLSVCCTML